MPIAPSVVMFLWSLQELEIPACYCPEKNCNLYFANQKIFDVISMWLPKQSLLLYTKNYNGVFYEYVCKGQTEYIHIISVFANIDLQFTIEKLTESQTVNALNNAERDVKKEHIGEIKFKLFDNTAPLTTQRFWQLASGVGGFGYTGTSLHQIIPDCIIQGGIVISTDTEGNRLLYEETFTSQVNYNFPCMLSFT